MEISQCPFTTGPQVAPNLFHHFHTARLAEIGKSLNRDVLPEDYMALLEQSAGKAVPDVLALHRPVEEDDASASVGNWAGDGPGAVAERPPQVELTMTAAPPLRSGRNGSSSAMPRGMLSR